MSRLLLLTVTGGVLIRLLFLSTRAANLFAESYEVSTPLTTWKRIVESVALRKIGVSPYSGDIVHEMPLILRTLTYFSALFGNYIGHFFIVVDIITAIILARVARYIMTYLARKELQDVKKHELKNDLMDEQHISVTPLYVMACYLFNPFSVVTCAAKSTAVVHNLILSATFLATLTGNYFKTCLMLGIATYSSIYSSMLILPAALYISQQDGNKFINILTKLCIGTGCVFASLLCLSYLIEGSAEFMSVTYGFIMSAPDFTPNLGLFWYMFTEMFEHFRVFFVCVFQINVFFYLAPLKIRIGDHPVLFFYLLICIINVFKSYISLADATLFFALLPAWRHLFKYTRNTFVVVCMLLAASVLAPIICHLWIYAGSANANFYFAISLVYSVALIFLFTDILFAYLRHQYAIKSNFEKVDSRQVVLE